MLRTSKFNKQIIRAAAVLSLVFIAVAFYAPINANAQSPSPQQLSSYQSAKLQGQGEPWYGKLIDWSLQSVVVVVGILLKVALMLFAWLLEVILQANRNIFNTPSVQIGFSVSLSIVNLGFVLGIIVIAIATILRYETYGMKHILLKLIAAAVLVNFSLVFASAIVNFADQFTTYFMNASGGGNFGQFVVGFGGSFSPQIASGVSSQQAQLVNSSVGGAIGLGLGNVIAAVVSDLVSIGMIFVAVISITALLIMLTIRFVVLGILLVVMPFAWLFWVFHNTEHLWQKWWHEFIRWTFFAPIAMFFIYLALTVWTHRQDFIAQQIVGQLASSPDSAAHGINKLGFLNAFFGTSLLPTIAEQLIILGLMIGGLFVANSFGVMGAQTAIGIAKSTGKSFGGYVGRRSRQLGGKAYHATRLQGLANRLQQSNLSAGRGALGKMWAKPADFVAAHLGRGIQAAGTYGNKGLVEAEKKRVDAAVKNLTPEQQGQLMSSLTAPQQAVLAEKMLKEGELQHMDTARWAGPDQKAVFERLGKGDVYDKIQKATAGAGTLSAETRDGLDLVEKDVAAIRTVNPSMTAEQLRDVRQEAMERRLGKNGSEEMQRSTAELIRGLKKGDKNQLADFFKGKAAFGLTAEATAGMSHSVARAIAAENPQLVATMVSQMDAKTLNRFSNSYRSALDAEINGAAAGSPRRAHLEETRTNFGKILLNNALTSEGGHAPHEEHEEAHEAPAAPAAGGGGGGGGGHGGGGGGGGGHH